ncbi:NAD-dependent epimerase/dehydratase family protein [Janibacter terrae]|uniref:NAD-dependent epimerase/dehydratase family protein n=1 Tax=Janibacter terrae TaxID=103817 RepID=UPI003D15E32F
MTAIVALAGSTGFVGKQIAEALATHGHRVKAIRAPRLEAGASSLLALRDQVRHLKVTSHLLRELEGCDVVINAAGLADAGASGRAIYGANSLLPSLLQNASAATGASMYIHLSSAGVQAGSKRLDETSQYSPISPYTRSKALGEVLLNDAPATIIYRPTSVHGPTRRVSKSLARFARSPYAAVVAPGTNFTPQVLVQNVADATRFIVEQHDRLPRIVLHPSEGHTTASILTTLGGKEPVLIPQRLAERTLAFWSYLPAHPRVVSNKRRLEMMWYGQQQSVSSLTESGWQPRYGIDEWLRLASTLRNTWKVPKDVT